MNETASELPGSQPLQEQLPPTPPRPIAADARVPTEERERFRQLAFRQ